MQQCKVHTAADTITVQAYNTAVNWTVAAKVYDSENTYQTAAQKAADAKDYTSWTARAAYSSVQTRVIKHTTLLPKLPILKLMK
jgi:hypothetical protein